MSSSCIHFFVAPIANSEKCSSQHMLTISKCSKFEPFKTFTHLHQLASKPDEGDHTRRQQQRLHHEAIAVIDGSEFQRQSAALAIRSRGFESGLANACHAPQIRSSSLSASGRPHYISGIWKGEPKSSTESSSPRALESEQLMSSLVSVVSSSGVNRVKAD